MKHTVRAIFYLHLSATVYCVTCAWADATGYPHRWSIPNSAVGFGLLATVLALPIAAGVAVVGSGCKHPVILVLTHCAMSTAQLFIGLVPLIS